MSSAGSVRNSRAGFDRAVSSQSFSSKSSLSGSSTMTLTRLGPSMGSGSSSTSLCSLSIVPVVSTALFVTSYATLSAGRCQYSRRVDRSYDGSRHGPARPDEGPAIARSDCPGWQWPRCRRAKDVRDGVGLGRRQECLIRATVAYEEGDTRLRRELPGTSLQLAVIPMRDLVPVRHFASCLLHLDL